MDRDGCVNAVNVVRVVESPHLATFTQAVVAQPSGCITGVLCPCFSLLDGGLGGVTSHPAPGDGLWPLLVRAADAWVGSIPAGGNNGRFPCFIYQGHGSPPEVDGEYPAQLFLENGRFFINFIIRLCGCQTTTGAAGRGCKAL